MHQAGDSLAQYEDKALALLDAYRTGTPEAMERHWRLTWHRRSWSAMRTYVQIGLGHQAAEDIDITLDDARWLVAREHAFEDWDALRRVVSRSTPHDTPEPSLLLKPMALLGDSDDRAHEPARTVCISREWSELLAESREPDVTGLEAHGQMTDALLRELSSWSQLTTLRLNGSAGVTDDGIAALAQLPQLKHLDVSGTAITDRGVAQLRAITSLRSLSLAGTCVTDAGVSSLRTLAALESVDLGGTACGDESIRTFTGLPALRRFVSGASTTDAGLPLFHEYPAFASWQGGEPRMALLSYDADPNRLQLRGRLTDRGVAALRGLDGLFGLDLDDRALALSGAALEPLVDLAHLGWLAFDTDDRAMRAIARMPRLQFLGCQDTECSDAGWMALGDSTSIEHIWGRRCYGLQRDGFLALSRMPSLRHLSVSCHNVDDAGVAALPSFPALRELMPMDVPDAGYRHIGRCTQLERLVLMYCRDTTDAATAHLASLARLQHYFASYTQITDRTPTLLAQLESLESVTFDSCAQLTNDGIAQLARLPRLREVRVSGRGVTSAVVNAFPPTVTVHYGL